MAQPPVKSAAAHEASDRPMTGPGFSGGAQAGPGAAGMTSQPQPSPERKSDPTRRILQGQSVTVIRDATKADAGYDAGHPGQLIVRLPDGTERIANPDQLSPAS